MSTFTLIHNNRWTDKVAKLVLHPFSRGKYTHWVDDSVCCFMQAIELSSEFLASTRFLDEIRVCERVMQALTTADDKICFGVDHVVKALDMGIVDTLVIAEDAPYLSIKGW